MPHKLREKMMNKIVVITGGSSGSGLDTTKLLREQGHTVIVLDRSSNGSDYQVDVTSDEQVKNAFIEIGKKYGKIDVLINNAGYGLNGVLELIPMEQVISQYNVNVFGVVRCIQNALPYMQKGARIINIGSSMAFLPMPYRSMYASSKSAVVAMSYSLRNELKGAGIDVVVVNPANIRTNFTKNKQVVADTNERYGDRPAKAQQRFDNAKAEAKRMPSIKVAKALCKIVNRKHTKPMYIVGANMKLAHFAMRFVSTKCAVDIEGKVCN